MAAWQFGQTDGMNVQFDFITERKYVGATVSSLSTRRKQFQAAGGEIFDPTVLGAGNPVPPFTDEILTVCPRFRILVIGKSGVGKSSLISNIFGVKTDISDGKPGKADIDKELISERNDHFILHDSMGFEPGANEQFETVKEFIRRRNGMQHIKDNIHAIWICFQIPTSGGRVLDTAEEQLLSEKAKETLGKVPMIAVFTQYDKLMSSVKYDQIIEKGKLDDQEVEKVAEKLFQENCVKPLRNCVLEQSVPYVRVSNEYATSVRLIQLAIRKVVPFKEALRSDIEACTSKANFKNMQETSKTITDLVEKCRRQFEKSIQADQTFDQTGDDSSWDLSSTVP
ncbi:hypothetical protein H0H81_000137 [Sphagnurus paluster]|uniref:G domain-containing protein n=1 Tax=Sphagnurus paluster TaxID=117069 RepID=A0A9P7FQD5_9AGAR|nr:hypothetical protein H0H81_000137 [Sphagnurus paluster]